jgi:hypothetical protein
MDCSVVDLYRDRDRNLETSLFVSARLSDGMVFAVGVVALTDDPPTLLDLVRVEVGRLVVGVVWGVSSRS